MAFFNMQVGDAPILKKLADAYTISDNFHQPAMGGTAGNHVELFDGDAIYWTTFNGMSTPPSGNIADPTPKSASSDKYVADK
jgi:phospholipase C